jgi:hypothetical protein
MFNDYKTSHRSVAYYYLVRCGVNRVLEKNYLKTGVVFALLTLVSTGCSQIDYSRNPNEITDVVPKQSESLIAPTKIFTRAPEPIPTIEPTLNAKQLAEEYGLDIKRTYERKVITTSDGSQYEALVDTYNQSPKIVFENGKAVKLDENKPDQRELMWGNLVPKDRVYIDPEIEVWSDGSKIIRFLMVYLGDVSWENKMVDGQNVKAAYLKVGLRDDDGILHVAKYGIDAIDMDPYHWFEYKIHDMTSGDDNYIETGTSVDEVINGWLSPGDVFIENSDDQGEEMRVWPVEPIIYGPKENIDINYMVTQVLFNSEKDKMMTSEEWKSLAQGLWPNDIKYLYATHGLCQVTNIPENWTK